MQVSSVLLLHARVTAWSSACYCIPPSFPQAKPTWCHCCLVPFCNVQLLCVSSQQLRSVCCHCCHRIASLLLCGVDLESDDHLALAALLKWGASWLQLEKLDISHNSLVCSIAHDTHIHTLRGRHTHRPRHTHARASSFLSILDRTSADAYAQLR